MTRSLVASLALLTGCSALIGEPERQQFCYQRPSGERRCFASERALSADVRREHMASVLAVEEQAKARALATVAERDAAEAAARAKSAADWSDVVQEDAFGVLVEIKENERERAAAVPSQ